MQRATQYFKSLEVGTSISLEDLVLSFNKNKPYRIGYEIGEANDDIVIYKIYVQLNVKNVVCVDLTMNKKTGTSKVSKKSIVDWGFNWKALNDGRRIRDGKL